MDLATMDSFRQLQVLTMLTLVLFFAPSVIPALRHHGRSLRIATLLLYFAGGGVILLAWYLRG